MDLFSWIYLSALVVAFDLVYHWKKFLGYFSKKSTKEGKLPADYEPDFSLFELIKYAKEYSDRLLEERWDEEGPITGWNLYFLGDFLGKLLFEDRLKAWGIICKNSVLSREGLIPIPRKYWNLNSINEKLFKPDYLGLTEFELDWLGIEEIIRHSDSEDIYKKIAFNRKKVIELIEPFLSEPFDFVKSPAPEEESIPDWTLEEMTSYIKQNESKLAEVIRTRGAPVGVGEYLLIREVEDFLRLKLFHGKMKAYGKLVRNHGLPHEESAIPKEYWEDNFFSPRQVTLRGDKMVLLPKKNMQYKDLRFNKQEAVEWIEKFFAQDAESFFQSPG